MIGRKTSCVIIFCVDLHLYVLYVNKRNVTTFINYFVPDKVQLLLWGEIAEVHVKDARKCWCLQVGDDFYSYFM